MRSAPRGASRPRILVATAILAMAWSPSTSSASTPGQKLWERRYDGPLGDQDYIHASAVSPDGSAVFVTGGEGTPTGSDYATAAYSTSDGGDLWLKEYDGPYGGSDHATAIVLSPDGSTVFVTGSSASGSSLPDIATIAYDAVTGAIIWKTRFDGHHDGAGASAIAVSPDGSTVFVTGTSSSQATGSDYLTVAIDAATGAGLWHRDYDGPGSAQDGASAVAVAPNGARVFVTGFSDASTEGNYDARTIAYDPATGATRWSVRYKGPSSLQEEGRAIAILPGTGTIVVAISGPDANVLAYAGASGAERWARRIPGGDPWALAADPAGGAVYAAGGGFVTRAYDATTGAKLWSRDHDGGYESANGLAVSPDGSKVFATGESWAAGVSTVDFLTLAYDAADGARRWARRYDGPVHDYDAGREVVVSPDGTQVFVSGWSAGEPDVVDYATIAYAT